MTVLLLAGCSTMTYSSGKPAREVSECIAGGWRQSAHSGLQAPVSLTRMAEYYFVAVELHPMFPSPLVTGSRHPFHPVWAEVRESPSGSGTTYHRAYQIMHEKIDRIVAECQDP